MMVAPLPDSERERLIALRRQAALDREAEAGIDELTRLAALVCDAPYAQVGLVDADRRWFTARVGRDALDLPRGLAFCASALAQKELLEVSDAAADPRFGDDPLVRGEPHLRFYAGVPLLDDEGRALGTLCVLDRVPRTLSAAQREGLQTLGRQVVARLELRRTREALAGTSAALAEARDAALVAGRARDVFLSRMSHALRTPLNTILGCSELLLEEPGGSGRLQAATDLRLIHRAGEELLATVEDILDLAGLAAGRPLFAPKDFAVEALVHQLEAEVWPQVERKRLAWRCVVEFDLRSMHTDPARLRQILLHLLVNAVKYTERGTVELSARRVPGREPAEVEFRVRDTGVGIAQDRLPLLFREFTPADAPGREREGAGLGLALARRHARLLGGDLTVESQLGRGSTFTLRLPARPELRARPIGALRPAAREVRAL